MSISSIVRRKARGRVIALEEASLAIKAAYEHNLLPLMEHGPEVRVGDVLRVPDDHPGADMRLGLWEITCLIDACRKELERKLREAEAAP